MRISHTDNIISNVHTDEWWNLEYFKICAASDPMVDLHEGMWINILHQRYNDDPVKKNTLIRFNEMKSRWKDGALVGTQEGPKHERGSVSLCTGPCTAWPNTHAIQRSWCTGAVHATHFVQSILLSIAFRGIFLAVHVIQAWIGWTKVGTVTCGHEARSW